MLKSVLAPILAILVATPAFAQVTVEDPWARATVPQQRATGVFMKLTADQPAKLVDVASPAANVVELHEMKMEGDVMKMRKLDGIDLPAGQSVELAPGGFHMMLIDLKAQINDGDIVPVTLTVERADGSREEIEVEAVARPLGQGGHHGHGNTPGHKH